MYKEIIDAIAPTGILRAAVNLGNTLLISSQKPDGTPVGVSPDLVHRIAQDLNIPYKFVCFECPGDLADSVDKNVWDIGNIAYEQTRAQKIEFSIPYILIDANFLVRQTAIFQTNNDVDKLGVRIAVPERSAYELWLRDNFRKSNLILTPSIVDSHHLFARGEVDALASLRPKLISEFSNVDLYRMIEPSFTSIRQSIGVKKGRSNVIMFLNNLIMKLIGNQFIADSLRKHGVSRDLTIPK